MARILASVILGVAFAAGCQSQPPAAPAQASSPHAPAARANEPPKYLDAKAIARLKAILPPPPADRLEISRGEGDLELAIQAEATPAARARAKSEESLHVWNFADVLGPGFSREKMPLTGTLMRQAELDSGVVTEQVKDHWARPRPPKQDDRVSAMFGLPDSASYPSGHSVRAMMWARLLAKLAPEKEQELVQRARLVAYDRVIAGVHYPTDVAAGMALGSRIADEIAASPAFQADLAKARSEWPSKAP